MQWRRPAARRQNAVRLANFKNQIAVVGLSSDHSSAAIMRHITEPFASNPATKVPTTIAEFGNSLYAVTAGFAPPAPDFVVRMPK